MAHIYPYGEARRIKYIFEICKNLLRIGPVNIDYFIQNLLKRLESINPHLKNYKRSTGIMRTPFVANNYIQYCNWLDVTYREENMISLTPYGLFFSTLNKSIPFALSLEEKISFFEIIVQREKIVELISKLRDYNKISEFIGDNSEKDFYSTRHFIETFFEWLVDLGLLNATSRTRGNFLITALGKQVQFSIKNSSNIHQSYITNLIKAKPTITEEQINATKFRLQFLKSIRKFSTISTGHLDPNLYSAKPLLLDVQLNIILKYGLYITIKNIIVRLKELVSTDPRIIFNWDKLSESGYIKIYKR